jgi:hypothetical protein
MNISIICADMVQAQTTRVIFEHADRGCLLEVAPRNRGAKTFRRFRRRGVLKPRSGPARFLAR